MIHAEVTRKLVTDDNKVFREGQDITFLYALSSVVCTIKRIHEKKGNFDAENVEIDGVSCKPRKFLFEHVMNADFVYYD